MDTSENITRPISLLFSQHKIAMRLIEFEYFNPEINVLNRPLWKFALTKLAKLAIVYLNLFLGILHLGVQCKMYSRMEFVKQFKSTCTKGILKPSLVQKLHSDVPSATYTSMFFQRNRLG